MNKLLIFSKKTFLTFAIVFGLITAISTCFLFINNENAIAKKAAKPTDFSNPVNLKVDDSIKATTTFSGESSAYGKHQHECYRINEWDTGLQVESADVDAGISVQLIDELTFKYRITGWWSGSTVTPTFTVEVWPDPYVTDVAWYYKGTRCGTSFSINFGDTLILKSAYEGGTLSGRVFDSFTQTPIPNTIVTTFDESHNRIDQFPVPGTDGFTYKFNAADYPNQNAYVEISADGYNTYKSELLKVTQDQPLGNVFLNSSIESGGVLISGGQHHQMFNMVGGVYRDGELIPGYNFNQSAPSFAIPWTPVMPTAIPIMLNDQGQIVVNEVIEEKSKNGVSNSVVADIKLSAVADDSSYYLQKWTLNGQDLVVNQKTNLDLTIANSLSPVYAQITPVPPAPDPEPEIEIVPIEDLYLGEGYLPETLDTLPLAEISLISALLTLLCLTGFAFSREHD